MTVRSWDRNVVTGTSDAGYPAPYKRDTYSQNGANTSKVERLKRIYGDHPYTMSRNRYNQPASKTKIWWDTVIKKTNVSTFGAWASFGAVPPPDLSKIVGKLLENWRSSTFNAGVFVGEGGEAAEMIVDKLKDIALAARELRRRNFGGALAKLAHVPKADRRKALKALSGGYLANAWLELQYGWKPLLSDIYSMADFIKPKPAKNTVRSSGRESSQVCHGLSSYPDADIYLKVNERRRHLKVSVANTPSLGERLGLTDPATIAWELTPFSFVIDWFMPIGSIIAALHAKQAMSVTMCCDTSVTNQFAQLPVYSGGRYGNFVCMQSATATFDAVSMTRSVYPSLPSVWQILGNQYARSIVNESDPIFDHLANAAALARSQLSRLR